MQLVESNNEGSVMRIRAKRDSLLALIPTITEALTTMGFLFTELGKVISQRFPGLRG